MNLKSLTFRGQQLLMKLYEHKSEENPTELLRLIIEREDTFAHQILAKLCDLQKLLTSLLTAGYVSGQQGKTAIEKIFELAAEKAVSLNKNYVGTEHILCGILLSDTKAGEVLKLFVTAEQIIEAIVSAEKAISVVPSDDQRFKEITDYLARFPPDGNKTQAINDISAILTKEV